MPKVPQAQPQPDQPALPALDPKFLAMAAAVQGWNAVPSSENIEDRRGEWDPGRRSLFGSGAQLRDAGSFHNLPEGQRAIMHTLDTMLRKGKSK